MADGAAEDKKAPHKVVSSLQAALDYLAGDACQDILDNIFVIGGGQVYADALQHPACHVLHITDIASDPECDTFLPEVPDGFKLWSKSAPVVSRDKPALTFKCYVKCASAAACLDAHAMSQASFAVACISFTPSQRLCSCTGIATAHKQGAATNSAQHPDQMAKAA